MAAGHLDMQTDVVDMLLHRLTGTGDELDSAWRAGQGDIAAGEAEIGADELSQAFRQIYLGDSQLVRGTASELPAVLRADARIGASCVAAYCAADARAAEILRATGR
ncbi:hypothetical protein [Plantactinospora sp. CA-290183]|uniref:hypothetical protein n=1 Tax=Plantactinospora sp. CA-290183 TaxID=3240006 RepID=UPI003D92621A